MTAPAAPDRDARARAAWSALPGPEREALLARARDENPSVAKWPVILESQAVEILAARLGIEEEAPPQGAPAPAPPKPPPPDDPAPDRPPPPARNLAAEMALLAGMVADNAAIPDVLEVTGPDEFGGAATRPIFRAIVALRDEGKPADRIFLAERLAGATVAGSATALGDVLATPAPDRAALLKYAELVHEKYLERAEEEARRELARLTRDGSLVNGKFQEAAFGLLETINARYHPAGPRDPELADWPAPAGEEALYGVPGDVLRAIGPRSIADPMAVLGQFLAAFGNMAGRHPCWYHEDTRHGLNLYLVVVGPTSFGAKGTSWRIVKRLLSDGCDPDSAPHWSPRKGLISGEGLTNFVRDPTFERRRREGGRQGRLKGINYDRVEVDAGAEDKRALFVETEFSTVLTVINARKGSTLGEHLCDGWDGEPLGNASRGAPMSATDHHISVIGHITFAGLRGKLTKTDQANGFGNRFLWACSRQADRDEDEHRGPLINWEANGIRGRIRDALAFAREDLHHKDGLVFTRDADAEKLWKELKRALTPTGPDLLSAMKARAKPQVMRLAHNYAVLDRSRYIRADHLRAGLAYWDYCARSLRYIFDARQPDPATDRTMRAFRMIADAGEEGVPQGRVTREIFKGQSKESKPVFEQLLGDGLIRTRKVATGGREATVLMATRMGNTVALSALCALSPPPDASHDEAKD